MTRSPIFSPAVETTIPPPTSDLTARRPSPPGPTSLALPWRHDHPYCPASLSPSRFLSICECQVDGAPQDHRRVKRLTRLGLGFGGFWTARRTLAGFEAMAMIRKGQVPSVGGDDIRAQATFIDELFQMAA